MATLLMSLCGAAHAQVVFSGPFVVTYSGSVPDFSAGAIIEPAGGVQIGAGDDTFGNIAGSILNDGQLIFDFTGASGNVGLNALTGSGTLTKNGAGTLLVTGAPWTLSGTTTINAGAINGVISSTGQLIVNGGSYATGGASSFGSLAGTGGTVNIGVGGSVTVGSDNSNTSYDGTLTGGGNLVKNGTGTLTLTQVPGHTGTTTISGGTLQIGDGGAAAGSISGTITNNSALVFNSSAAINLSGLDGSGSLTKNGTGTLAAFGGAWTHSGNTTINAGGIAASINSAGRLVMNGGQFDTGGSSFGSLAGTGGSVFINSGTLTVGGDNSSTSYAGTIESAGDLVKSGTGTLTLTQVPLHDGTTTISGGTLQIGDGGAAAGSISGTITNNSALVFDSSAAINLSGLDGSGSLTKNGTGTLAAFGGAWTHSGNTTINAGGIAASINSTGRLVMNGGQFDTGGSSFGSLAGTGGSVFINSGTLTVGGDNSSTSYAGTIESAGDLVKNGTGTLTLTQVPLHDGTTTISGGTLQIGDGGATAGSISGTITNNSALVFDSSAAINLSGLDGSGSLTKNGTGTLAAFGGAWTHSGNTTINAGGIAASINSAGRLVMNGGQFDTGNSSFGSIASTGGNVYINGGGTLTVGSDNSSTTFAGEIGGDGTLVKNGSGTLTLSGTSGSTGAIAVNGGMVVVNGSTTAAVTVNGGGMLGGSGSVGGLTAATGAVIAPGNSIGTLTVNGALIFNAGSIYRVEADAAGAADRINVTGAPGTATINGGTVDVQAGAGTYNTTTVYTILNATGGVTGTFNTVTSNLAFLTPSLSYDPNNVFLTLARNDISFQGVAQTPNQIAVARMLEPVAAAVPGGDMGAAISAITGLSAVQARAAYDAIGGASIAELRRANVAFVRGFGDSLDARIRQSAPVRVAVAGPAMLLSPENERGLWIKAGAQGYKVDGDGNAFGSEVRGGGISFGVDASPSRDVVVGIAGSYGRSRLDFDGIGDSGKTRNAAIGVYGHYTSGPWTFKGVAAYAFGDNEMNRNVSFGAISRTARGEFDSRSATVYGEAGYDIPMSGYRLRPLAGLSWTHARQDGYSESGAGALNLNVAGSTIDSLRSLIGFRTLHSSGNLRIEPRLVWSHEFGDLNTPLQAQLSGAGAAGNFTVSGVRLKRDTLTAGLTLSGSVSKGTELFVDVQAEGNSRQSAYAAYAGLRMQW